MVLWSLVPEEVTEKNTVLSNQASVSSAEVRTHVNSDQRSKPSLVSNSFTYQRSFAVEEALKKVGSIDYDPFE